MRASRFFGLLSVRYGSLSGLRHPYYNKHTPQDGRKGADRGSAPQDPHPTAKASKSMLCLPPDSRVPQFHFFLTIILYLLGRKIQCVDDLINNTDKYSVSLSAVTLISLPSVPHLQSYIFKDEKMLYITFFRLT